MLRSAVCAIALLAVAPFAVADPPHLLKDLNLSDGITARDSSVGLGGPQIGDTFYFGAYNPSYDDAVKLLTSDGTPAGTRVVRELPVPYNQFNPAPSKFVILGGIRIFPFIDPNAGSELWRTDGTAAGTYLVRDILSGIFPGVSQTAGIAKLGSDRALFSGNDGQRGEEVWVTDGTASGTKLFADLAAGQASSLPYDFTTIGSDMVVFRANDGLYAVTTASPTPKQIAKGIAVRSITDAGGRIYFEGQTDATGWELWTSDGTSAGTHLVKEIVPGAASAFGDNTISVPMAALGTRVVFPVSDVRGGRGLWVSDGTDSGTYALDTAPVSDVVTFRDRVYYLATDANRGSELWSTDGSTITPVSQTPAGTKSAIRSLVAADNHLYFINTDDHLTQLWSSDGSLGGTVRVTDVKLPESLSFIAPANRLQPYRDGVFFRATDSIHGREPWHSDGTAAGTMMLINATADLPGSSAPGFYAAVGNRAIFSAGNSFGRALWSTDGTSEGTQSIGPDVNGLSVTSGDTYYFALGQKLWKSDGTAAGTVAVTTLSTPSNFSSVESIAPIRGGVVFTAAGGSNDNLWSTDGTASGTKPLPIQNTTASPISASASIAGNVYFFASYGSAASLWKTDGSQSGTVRITSAPRGAPIAVGGVLLWFARPLYEWEIWRSTGSADGTQKVVSLTGIGLPVAQATDRLTAAMLNRLFFVAGDVAGQELWVTDGTASGTKRLKDINPGSGSSNPADLTVIDNRIFFTADDGKLGRELWVTDGSEEGTKLVRDIAAGAPSSSPQFMTAIGGLICFAANDGARGSELWQSDGTAEGTSLVADINPGPASSSPRWLLAVGNTLYFSALDPASGTEPWTYVVAAPSALSIADVSAPESASAATTTVRLSAPSDQRISVDWYTEDGTASAGSDYSAVTGTLVFEPGEVEKQLALTILRDTAIEGNETFYVRLRNPVNALISDSLAAVVIEDGVGQADLQVSIDHRAISIHNSGPSTATTVRLRVHSLDSSIVSDACHGPCAIGDIRPSETAIYYLNSIGTRDVVFGAEVSATQTDPNLADNTATIFVQGNGGLALSTVPPYPVTGSAAKFTFVRSSKPGEVLVTSSSNTSILPFPTAVTFLTESVASISVVPAATGDVTINASTGEHSTQYFFAVHVVAPGQKVRWTSGLSLEPDFGGAWTFGEMHSMTLRILGVTPDKGIAPSGTVTFSAGNTVLGTAPVADGTARWSTAIWPAGTPPITAVYNGDSNFAAVTAGSSTIVRRATAKVSAYMQGNSVRIVVSGAASAAPRGAVTITEGDKLIVNGLPLQPGAVPGESFAVLNTPLAAGPHTLLLVYYGDPNYLEQPVTVQLGTLKRRTARH